MTHCFIAKKIYGRIKEFEEILHRNLSPGCKPCMRLQNILRCLWGSVANKVLSCRDERVADINPAWIKERKK